MTDKSETMKQLDKIFEKVGPKWLDWHFEVFKSTQNFVDRIFPPKE